MKLLRTSRISFQILQLLLFFAPVMWPNSMCHTRTGSGSGFSNPNYPTSSRSSSCFAFRWPVALITIMKAAATGNPKPVAALRCPVSFWLIYQINRRTPRETLPDPLPEEKPPRNRPSANWIKDFLLQTEKENFPLATWVLFCVRFHLPVFVCRKRTIICLIWKRVMIPFIIFALWIALFAPCAPPESGSLSSKPAGDAIPLCLNFVVLIWFGRVPQLLLKWMNRCICRSSVWCGRWRHLEWEDFLPYKVESSQKVNRAERVRCDFFNNLELSVLMVFE